MQSSTRSVVQSTTITYVKFVPQGTGVFDDWRASPAYSTRRNVRSGTCPVPGSVGCQEIYEVEAPVQRVLA